MYAISLHHIKLTGQGGLQQVLFGVLDKNIRLRPGYVGLFLSWLALDSQLPMNASE